MWNLKFGYLSWSHFLSFFALRYAEHASDVSPKPPPVLLFQISNAYNLSTEAQMFTRLQGFTTFYPSQILLQTCSCSKPRLICRKGSLKHISSQLFNLSRLFFLSRTHVTPFFSLKMIEAEGSQTFRWSPTKASKKSSKQPGRNCHSQQQLKPIYESKFSSEYSTLSDKYRGPTLPRRSKAGSATENMAAWSDSLSGPDSTSETTHLILSYSGSVVLSSELVGTDVMVLSVMKPQQGAHRFEAGNMDDKTHVVVLVETKQDQTSKWQMDA